MTNLPEGVLLEYIHQVCAEWQTTCMNGACIPFVCLTVRNGWPLEKGLGLIVSGQISRRDIVRALREAASDLEAGETAPFPGSASPEDN